MGGQRERRAEREKEAGEGDEPAIGEGKAAWEEPEAEEAEGYKMRGGRRVKVKGKVSDTGEVGQDWERLTAG